MCVCVCVRQWARGYIGQGETDCDGRRQDVAIGGALPTKGMVDVGSLPRVLPPLVAVRLCRKNRRAEDFGGHRHAQRKAVEKKREEGGRKEGRKEGRRKKRKKHCWETIQEARKHAAVLRVHAQALHRLACKRK